MTKKTAEEIAELIGVPLDQWPGNCHAIASMMLREGALDDMPTSPDARPKLVYGHWLGPVVDGTVFSGRPVVSHGWIEIPSESLPGGLIVDPTRWYFEGKPPYIYVGISDFYDIGGSVFRNSLHEEKPPACVLGQGKFPLPLDDNLAGAIRSLVLCNCVENRLSIDQLFWLGNLDPRLLAPNVWEIYNWLNDIGQRAIIPVDYWNYFMEPVYDPAEAEAEQRAEQAAHMAFHFPGSHGPKAWMEDQDDARERYLEDLYWQESEQWDRDHAEEDNE